MSVPADKDSRLSSRSERAKGRWLCSEGLVQFGHQACWGQGMLGMVRGRIGPERKCAVLMMPPPPNNLKIQITNSLKT